MMQRDPFLGSAAVAAGLVSPDELRGPRFVRLFRGIYVGAGVRTDYALRCRAAALAIGGRGVLVGWAAAELLGAPCAPLDAPVELVVPGGGRGAPGLVVRAGVLPAAITARRVPRRGGGAAGIRGFPGSLGARRGAW